MDSNQIITIFGGSGFIGRHVVELLVSLGYVVRICSRNPDLHNDLTILGKIGQVFLVEYSTDDYESIAACINEGDVVINLIGSRNINLFYSKTYTELINNVTIAASKKKAAHLIYFSTLLENNNIDYVKHKIECEKTMKGIMLNNLTIIKSSVIYGKGDRFLDYFARILDVFKFIPNIKTGENKLQPIYVVDVAQVVLKVIKNKMFGTLELAGPTKLSIKNILDIIVECKGKKKRVIRNIPYPICYFFAYLFEFKISYLFTKSMVGNMEPFFTRQDLRLLKENNVTTNNLMKELGIKPSFLDVKIQETLNK